MSLIYRAIWQDYADGIHDRARDAFAWWLNLRYPGTRTFCFDREESVGGAKTQVRIGMSDVGSIQRCTARVDDGIERVKSTLTTTATRSGIGSVWVDQERVSRDAFTPYLLRAPELSTRLIACGTDPRRGTVKLTVRPTALKSNAMDSLVHVLTDSTRDLPMVVFTPSAAFSATACGDAAQYAARVLAGNAGVYLVGSAGRPAIADLLGAEFALAEGTVRIYLPGLCPGEPSPWRHHTIDANQVLRDPKGVAHTIVQLLAPSITSRRAPAEYPRLRPLLDTRDTESTEHLVERIHDLEVRLEASENHAFDLLADLEESEGRLQDLQNQVVSKLLRPDQTTEINPSITCCTDAFRVAQRFLHGLVVPDSANRSLTELDQKLEAKTWGRMAWRAFLALDAFAQDVDFQPGFWEWCKAARSPLSWPATGKKLAMAESDSVLRQESLRTQRMFKVDPLVDPSGSILMTAHVKIAAGGGPQIPRIYFYDDRHGATAKVHIGFFGPHHLVPTSSW